MGRGQKTCKHCGATTGPRAYTCPSCNKPFIIKGQEDVPAAKVLDWKSLNKGDLIKVVSGTGPYYMSGEERVSIGYAGIFKVDVVEDNGIHAYPVKSTDSGHCFIWMGAKGISPVGLFNRPHKIRKVLTNVVKKRRKKRAK